jgi:hypothetical protein
MPSGTWDAATKINTLETAAAATRQTIARLEREATSNHRSSRRSILVIPESEQLATRIYRLSVQESYPYL